MTLYKLSIGGPQEAGDLWSSGLHVTGALSLAAAVASWSAIIDTAFTAMAALWSETTYLFQAGVATLDPATQATLLTDSFSPSIAGSAGIAQPSPRDAVVVGLRTAVAGPRGRGRMYLPAPDGSNLSAVGLLTLDTQTAYATDVRTMLQDLVTAGLTPVILGAVVGGSITIPVTKVTVGRVLGSQRRRTNKISPAYVNQSI